MTKAKKQTAAKTVRRSSRSTTVPEMFMRQKFTNRAKVSSDDDEEEENDELASDSSDSEQEEKKRSILRRHSRGKKTATRVDLDGDSQLLEQVTEESISSDNIFENIVAEQESIEDLVKNWVKKYQSNKKEALKDLVNFTIRSSGCLIAVKTEAITKEEGAVDALQELQDKLAELPSTDYPIVSKIHKSFKKNLLLFFAELIDQCQGGAIYDGELIETLQSWLTTMSSSLYRPFRHTATIIALRIMTSLCIVADRTRVEISTNTRQTNSEKKRGNTHKDKQKMLKQNATVLQRKRKDLNEYLTDFFESIFVHRSRDVESVIRTECIKELGQFIQNYQSRFVENSYLRYFGWAFNDQHASVRCESIKALTRLYKMEDIINKLKHFTDRFTERLEEMALYDIDVSVRAHTVALCSHLFQQKQTVLSEQGKLHLSRLIVSDVARVRNSAAPFIKAVIESEMIKPMLLDAKASLAAARGHARRGVRTAKKQEETQEDDDAINKSWITFKAFAAFLVKQIDVAMKEQANQHQKKTVKDDDEDMDQDDGDEEMEETTSAVVTKELYETRNLIITKTIEALWTPMKELQDYPSLSEYLCRDHTDEIEACYRLNEEEETILVNVYLVCLKTAIHRGLETQLVGIKDRRKIDPAILEETKNEISRHLVPTLPELMTKYADDVNKLVHLVYIPTLMNLNVYMVLQQEREYEMLLQTLIKIYLGNTFDALLLNCSQSMACMSAATYLDTINEIEFLQLQEAVVKQVRDACAGMDLAIARFTQSTMHALSASISRLDYLLSFSDATVSMDDAHQTTTNTIEYMGQLVDRSGMGYKKELNISKSALSILSRYLLYKCYSIQNNLSITEDTMHLIERRRDWVIDKLLDLITDNTPLEEVRSLALGYLVDAYWVLDSDLFDHQYQRLKLKCPADTQKACVEYVKQEIEAWKTRVAKASTETTENEENKSKRKLSKKEEKEKEEAEKQKQREAERDKELNQLFYQNLMSFARGITVGVFDMMYAPVLLDLYGPTGNDAMVEDIVKALAAEFEQDAASNVMTTEEICRAYLVSLKTSFEQHVGESLRSIDPTLKLARLQANSLKPEGPPPQVVVERLHIDGISYVFEKLSDALEKSDHDERVNVLKFFKVLNAFGKTLTRARDIAKIHNHLEDCIQQYNIEVEEDQSEWGYYLAYVKTIDEVLKKKGLRYDPSMRANNAETPAAHVFDDTEMNDIPENPPQDDEEQEQEEEEGDDDDGQEGIGKRTRSSNNMDIDDKFVTKRRR